VPVDDIPSPTFTLVQQYDFPPFSLFHIDLYRIDQPADVLELGVEDFFADGVSLIEWPERLGPYLPADRLHLTLRPGDHDDARTVEIEKCGAWKTRDLEFPDNG
jgi:tRNA threonylcarbamoyladenosine biosynthesis protein TsaE